MPAAVRLLAALLCLAALAAEERPGDGRLRLIGYNVFKGFEQDEPRRRAVAAWLAAQRPDVVAFMELNGYTEERLRQEAAAWGHPHAVLLKRDGYPTGLTARAPITDVQRVVEGFHHGVIRARVLGLGVYVLHLSPLDCRVRLREAGQILDGTARLAGALAATADGPVVLIGDCNALSPQDRGHYETSGVLERTRVVDRKPGRRNLDDEGRLDYRVMARFAAAGLVDVVGEKHPRPGASPSYPTPLEDPALAPAALPVLTHLGAADRVGDAVRRAVARREGRVSADAAALTDLVAMRTAYRHHGFLLDAGRELLRRCTHVPGGAWHMPPSHHADADTELRQRAEAGLRRRYACVTPALQQRLDHELAVIRGKGFSGYLLTVADLARGRRTCGRGSGASSLVVYCLGITNVDPVRYRLLFERFLNPARTDPPDLDVDFPWDERDAVLAAAIAGYGRDHVAMVANHNHLRRWSALRVVARAYGRPDHETTAVRAQVKAHERYGLPLRLAEPWPGILAQASHLVGVPHHAGLHCGGVVITPQPLRDLVPIHPAAKRITLEPAPGDEAPPPRAPIPAIAWEKDGAEAMGLVKIDLLGNRSLAVVRDCVRDLAEDGIAIDEARWRPDGDPLTRRLVASGDTLGCFYIESPAMRQLQAKAGSGDFDRLVIHSSIIRPAANRWIDAYLDRLAHHRATGQHKPEWYPHPALRGLLSESFGILSYQEDVMLAAIEIAGFDDRQANALRKALGLWDTQARLTRFADDFRRGALARGATPAAIDTVWGMIASFAGYSFCKAHSASYAMVSFQCAYLKAHHPAHFLARVVANAGGFYAPGAYLEEARRLGIRILGPCAAASAWLTRREAPDAIRIGLHLVPGLSAETGRRLAAERERLPFTGIADLRRRIGLGASQLDTLARCGALDALCPGRNRDQVVWIATGVGLDRPPRVEEDDDGVVQRIFPAAPVADPVPPAIAPRPPRALAWEVFRILGVLPAGHPIHFCDRRNDRLRCRDLGAAMAKARVRLVAWPITRKQVEAHPRPKPGRSAGPPEPMAFVTLEDETGLVETVWFPQAYRTYGPLLEREGPLRLHGVVEISHGAVALTVQTAEAVEPLP